eukprot:gnl/MRDRNA2_/MRDRNA2_56217_c0_seq1.p1 gnl/MRDRNA2_/MRDRNA2_56217_c0~~gnl/MRDRNA2_/MRDRNA2_56217_c0_seq1.p1  ORF type:complete len:156 (+),score=10.82 gnl/MRDRNA2_/MRDRNA2_56217_c0_seq1:59-526(+)
MTMWSFCSRILLVCIVHADSMNLFNTTWYFVDLDATTLRKPSRTMISHPKSSYSSPISWGGQLRPSHDVKVHQEMQRDNRGGRGGGGGWGIGGGGRWRDGDGGGDDSSRTKAIIAVLATAAVVEGANKFNVIDLSSVLPFSRRRRRRTIDRMEDD